MELLKEKEPRKQEKIDGVVITMELRDIFEGVEEP